METGGGDEVDLAGAVRLEEGKVFAGHRIDGVVGKGGMGIVYQATQLALDLTVALKVMAPELAEDDEFRQRFRRESRLAASLDDAHIVPVRHAGEEEGLLYVTMRLVNGPDLGAASRKAKGRWSRPARSRSSSRSARRSMPRTRRA